MIMTIVSLAARCKRTFKRPLILGECSEINCVCLLVSWPAPLAQYLPFLVNRINSFFLQVTIILIAGGKVPYKRHFTKEQRRNDVCCLGLLVRCLVPLRLASYPGPFEGRRRKGLVHTDSACANIHRNLLVFYTVAPTSHVALA